MSARPSDIPESVWVEARTVCYAVLDAEPVTRHSAEIIARAILAAEKRGEERERERCALIADAVTVSLNNTDIDNPAMIFRLGASAQSRVAAHAIRNPSHTNEGV